MKTICIYHRVDCDGWMSGAIVKYWWEKNNQTGVFYDNPYKGDCSIVAGKENETSLTMLGFSHGDQIPNLKYYDQVIMCDISFPVEEMLKLRNKLVYIDHHISAIRDICYLDYDGIQRTDLSACELTWNFYFPDEEMPKIVEYLGKFDTYRHIGSEEEKTIFEFQHGARNFISNYSEAYDELIKDLEYLDIKDSYISIYINRFEEILNTGKIIYEYLCKNAKGIYERGFYKKFFKYNFLFVNCEHFNPMEFGIDYTKDGYDGVASFYYKDGKWKFSLRSIDIDVSEIAKSFGGGGHRLASGFSINNYIFNNLIKKYET